VAKDLAIDHVKGLPSQIWSGEVCAKWNLPGVCSGREPWYGDGLTAVRDG